MDDSSAFVTEVETWAIRLAGETPGLLPQAVVGCGLPARLEEQLVGPSPEPIGTWAGGRIVVSDRRLVFLSRSSGVSARNASLPARLTRAIGLPRLLAVGCAVPVSAMAGAAGCLVVSDHLNLRADNPLVGPNRESWGVRFPDLSEPYEKSLRAAGIAAGAVEGILAEAPDVPEAGCETDSRLLDASLVQLAASLGADALGHGVVPLAIAAAHAGLIFGAVLDLRPDPEGPGVLFSRVLSALLAR